MLERIYQKSPHLIQNSLISIFNIKAYFKRYGGDYKLYLNNIRKNNKIDFNELIILQNKKYEGLVAYAINNGKFFKKHYENIKKPYLLSNIENLPILNKEKLRLNISTIQTIEKSKGIVSKTGGTTGKSLEVLFTPGNMQERFAMLDNFRAKFGYKLGKKTAWFSGKNLISQKDIKKKRFWKTDYWYKVRYYSTFHIKDVYLKYYLEDLIKYQPEYFVGFPSTMLEIAKYGLNNNYNYPANSIKAIFPTAESITPTMRKTIETFFKTKMYNQYASSEGAPFIFECENGKLHLELQSGVFEVLDDDGKPAKSGRLIVTSFTTYGTPLIRYDIGDSISLAEDSVICNCGNNNPIVKEILGRIDDFVYSPENGKINLGNISNTLKDTKGILKFQVVQNALNTIELLVVIDNESYNKNIEIKFLDNWKERVGDKMKLNITYVDEISAEKSGKFRMVKNNIKHLLND